MEFTSMPFPFNRLAALKLIPMGLFSLASGCRGGLASPQFRRFRRVLGDSAFHAKFLAARHLQNHVPGLVQILNDYLVLNLRIPMHFNYILGQFVGCGAFLATVVSCFGNDSETGRAASSATSNLGTLGRCPNALSRPLTYHFPTAYFRKAKSLRPARCS